MSKNVTFIWKDEEHTLGNLLRSYLLENQQVLFAAYKVPYPLTPHTELRLQTMDDTAVDVLNGVVDLLINKLDVFENAFNTALSNEN